MSTKFKDKTGKEWDLSMTLQDAWMIEEYDFQQKVEKIQLIPPQDDLFTARLTDSKTLFGMAWIILQNQIRDHNQIETDQSLKIKDELDLAKRLDGRSINSLRSAMWESLINFFPDHAISLRALTERFSRVVEKQNTALSGAVQKHLSDERIDQLVKEAEAEVDQEIETALKKARYKAPTS